MPVPLSTVSRRAGVVTTFSGSAAAVKDAPRKLGESSSSIGGGHELGRDGELRQVLSHVRDADRVLEVGELVRYPHLRTADDVHHWCIFNSKMMSSS